MPVTMLPARSAVRPVARRVPAAAEWPALGTLAALAVTALLVHVARVNAWWLLPVCAFAA